MSGILEGIVRPFATGDIGPPRMALQGGLGNSTATANAPDNTIINPGANGSVKTFSGSFSLTITFYYVKKPKEKKKGSAAAGGPVDSAGNEIQGGNPNPQPGNPPQGF